jgi:hypothetical protein
MPTTLVPDQVALRAEYDGQLARRVASHAVVNPTDRCSLSCAHCLYSAPLQKQSGAPRPAELIPGDAARLGAFLAEAGVRQLVVSGGGEPLEALDAVVSLVGSLASLEELVVITSGHYARSPSVTAAHLDPVLVALARHPAAERLIVRLSADAGHRIGLACYRRVTEWAAGQEGGPVDVRVILRSSMHDLLQGTAGSWLSAFGAGTLAACSPDALAVIDGMPTAWVRSRGAEVPVIFKPDYGLGLARAAMRQDWKQLVQAEERAGTPFNLSWRGPRGEGHNYYGTLLRGEGHCRALLGGAREYVAPKQDQAKGLSLYATASGRLYVNAGPPDAWLSISQLPGWGSALARYDRDALMNLVVNNPTALLYAMAREADPGIVARADSENFVFSPARLSMRTARLRAYLTGLQASAGLLAEPGERSRAWERLAGLADAGHSDGRHADPIVGNCESAYER